MPKYKKKTERADMTGELYEVKMSALLFLRALQTGQPFLLASNMDAAGCFDDVVLTLGDSTVFLQLKHKEKSETILNLNHLARDKKFNLPKYLKSYLDIKQHWQYNPDLRLCGRFEDAKFIIFTNARVDENLVNAAGTAELLNIISTGGACVCLTELFDSLPKYIAVLSAAVSTENVRATPELWEVVHKLYSKQAQALPSRKQLEEILKCIKSLGDLTHYQQFISQLYLCTGQMAEEDLDHLIRCEILTCCGTDRVLLEFMNGVQKWWRKSKCHLTVKEKFFQNILKAIAGNITKDSSELKVKFVENECDDIRKKFKSGNRKIYLRTGCTNLSCIKVLQSFKKPILVDVSILQTRLSEVLAVWRLGMCDVLVVEGEIADTSILHKLASMPDSKCVVVISVNEQPQLYQQFKFASCIDTFRLNQLDLDSQHEVLEHEVIFQGFHVKLNSLADVSFLQSAVTADIVDQLHNTLQIGHKLDDLHPCYIPRKFVRKEYVNEQIFREEQINLAVTGTSEERLARVVPIGEKVQKFDESNITIGTACKYFLVEGETDFIALCSVINNIHWIEACEEGFLWKNSKGDMSPLIEHLQQKNVSYAGAKEILELPHRLVLFNGKPGMGKSTEMNNIAHMIKRRDPSTWVITVDLNQHSSLLSQNETGAVEFLETVAKLKTEFQKQLFKHQLESGGNVVILLDGFDEISPNYSKRVFDLLARFSDSEVKKIFVTSRPVMIKELQEKLSILAFSIHAFTPDDIKNFLISYWEQTIKENFNLSNFISSLLELAETSLSDKLKEFTGIPLQCKLLAEVFQDEALHYCQTGEVRLPQSLNVLQLYDKFFDKKWQVYCNKLNVEITNVMVEDLVQDWKLQFQQSIMCCALVSYFHDDDIRGLHNSEYILKQNQEFVEKFKKGGDKSGIVTDIVNNNTVFVHRTFTEYFVAMWFSKHLDSELDNLSNFYLNKNVDVVRKFLDRILAQEIELHTAVLNEDLPELENLLSEKNVDINIKDGGDRTALHLAIVNYFNIKNKINNLIIQTLLEHGADFNCEDKVLHWRPLRLAEEIRAWYVVDKLLEKQVNTKDLVLIKTYVEKLFHIQNSVKATKRQGMCQSMISALEHRASAQYDMSGFLAELMYTSLSEGYVNLVEFTLNCGLSVGHYIFHRHSYNKSSMLHVAAEHGQLRLVQSLIGQGAFINDKMCQYNNTPLMQAVTNGHLQVVKFLLNYGASINERNVHGCTALLLAATEGKYEIVELLLQKRADVEKFNKYNRTPLMEAAVHGHVQIVELLLNHGASVNARDEYKDTALLLATCEGKNEIVELLLQKKADVEIFGMYDRTSLMQAAMRGHVQIVQLLINHGASVNARDKYGNTALLLAVTVGENETVESLLQKGANVEISGEYNRTPLMEATVHGHVQIVEQLVNHGASINARNKNGHTALTIAASNGDTNIVHLLIQHMFYNPNEITTIIWKAGYGKMEAIDCLINNGFINSQDENGYSALSIATLLGKNEIVNLLLQKGADTQISSGEYNRTPLMGAAEVGHTHTVELLINRGASVNATDKYGNTALALASLQGKYEIIELLLQNKADFEIFGYCNRSPLIQAALCGHMQAVELLISKGASVNATNENGNTALLLAATEGKNETVQLLLQKEANVEVSDEYNRTPLMQAAMHGHVQIVELLINRGASVNARDKKGNTALLLAVRKEQKEIVVLLIQKGADVEITGYFIRTPLMEAAECGHTQIVELLINRGASVNARDKYGNTALLLAAHLKENEIVKLLLQKEADVEISGYFNRTPLMEAAEYGHVQTVELLINHGASVNARDKYGNTALLLAAHLGKNEIVELLLQNGADSEICNEYNRTPLMQAAECGHDQIVQFLINHGASVNKTDDNGNTALFLAASRGKNEIAALLVQNQADVETSAYYKRTPLMEAAECGHMQIVELLINHEACVNETDKNGNTALSLASINDHKSIVLLLLQHGAQK